MSGCSTHEHEVMNTNHEVSTRGEFSKFLNWASETSPLGLGIAHAFTRSDRMLKVYSFGFVVLFPQQREVLRLCHLTRGFARGTFSPPLHHVHTHTHPFLFPLLLESLLCLCVCLFFFALSVSSTVQCSVRESLWSTPDHFLWHTQQRPVCQLPHWQDEAMLAKKLCRVCGKKNT